MIVRTPGTVSLFHNTAIRACITVKSILLGLKEIEHKPKSFNTDRNKQKGEKGKQDMRKQLVTKRHQSNIENIRGRDINHCGLVWFLGLFENPMVKAVAAAKNPYRKIGWSH